MTEHATVDPPRTGPGKEVAARIKSAIAVLLALAVVIGGGWFVYTKGKEAASLITLPGQAADYPGPGGADVVVAIPEGTSVAGMGEILVEADVIRSTDAWDEAIDEAGEVDQIQAGNYRMPQRLPAKDALAILVDPGDRRVRNQVTVREGLALVQQIEELVKASKIPKKNFDAALKRPGSLGLPGYVGDNPEGVFFPQTYETTTETTATSLLKQMTAEYRKVTDDLDFEAKATALGLDPYEALIIASIIERETNRAEDRPKVARVILNRLDVAMPLQMDSTVAYATKNWEKVTTTDEQRRDPSPYNTYVHAGLPPGPIAAPGTAALEAAVNPADGDWLFFVTVNLDTGETKFAADEAGHQANVAEFQRWCQANRGRC